MNGNAEILFENGSSYPELNQDKKAIGYIQQDIDLMKGLEHLSNLIYDETVVIYYAEKDHVKDAPDSILGKAKAEKTRLAKEYFKAQKLLGGIERIKELSKAIYGDNDTGETIEANAKRLAGW